MTVDIRDIRALDPLLRRVRRDITAEKVEIDGKLQYVRSNDPLTDDLVGHHLNGGPARGMYLMRPGGRDVEVAVFDLDSHGGEVPWVDMAFLGAQIHESLELAYGCSPVAWRSSGGRGIHLMLVWDTPQDAYSVRQLMFGVLRAFGFTSGNKGVRAKQIEVFPKQDELTMEGKGSTGSMVAIPLGGASELLVLCEISGLLVPAPQGRADVWSITWGGRCDPVPVVERPTRAEGVVKASGDLTRQRAAAEWIAADLGTRGEERGYDDWLKDVFSICMAAMRSEEGRDLAHAFSASIPKYDAAAVDKRYDECDLDHPKGVTAERLPHEARGLGWIDPARAVPAPDVLAVVAEENRRAGQIEESQAIGDGLAGDECYTSKLTVEGMLGRFVHLAAVEAVADRMTGRIRKWEAALGEFAASTHELVEDVESEAEEGGKPIKAKKPKTVPALALWRKCEKRLSVDVATWRPGHGEFCEPPEITANNNRGFNTWLGLRPLRQPETTAEAEEGARIFLEHVEYLVPLAEQRERFLDWLAHIVQAPGVLPHTAYLMTTRATGIGRNWLSGVLARVLPGNTAVGVALGPLLEGKFNGRLSQKLLATVDETREGGVGGRYQRAERLKGMINEEVRHINPKYGTEVVEKNCCRWLMFSNHDDAIPFDESDRRIVVIANPTERRSPEYYSRLYDALNTPGLAAGVRKALAERDISAFNPGLPAPMSAAKERILAVMKPAVDQACAAFRAEWPGDVAEKGDIRRYVREYCGEEVSNKYLEYAMVREGMSAIPRFRINQEWFVFIQVKTSSELVGKVSAEVLVKEVEEARARFEERTGRSMQ